MPQAASANYRPQDIRNIILLGHSQAGKTTLAEAILHRCGAITRMGTVAGENTVSDYEAEARAHHFSTSSSVLFANHTGREINLIDTPGASELVGSALCALPAADTAVIVVNAVNGIELGTRRLFQAAGTAGLARMIVVNRIDENPAGLSALVAELRATFGSTLCCINLPTGGARDVIDCFDHDAGQADFGSVQEVHTQLLESSIEIDDATLERYLGGEAIDLPLLRSCFVRSMSQGHLVPILFTSAASEIGVDDLLHVLVEESPSPVSGKPRRLRRDGKLVEIPATLDAPFLGHVFKVTTDPYLGKIGVVRILQGKLDANTPFVCGEERKLHKAGHLLKLEGRDHPELAGTAHAGDLVAIAKLEELRVDTLIHAPELEGQYEPVRLKLPTPMYTLAVRANSRADDVKLSGALARLAEEDPTFVVAREAETEELLVSGLGELHLRLALERLKNRGDLTVNVSEPKVAYRETITASAEGHYRHKKQTGGAGQFGEVYLRVDPLARGEGYVFVDETFGGSIPHQFITSCEKGVQDALSSGALGGFPVDDVRVTLTDGKSHPVDSKDIAFRTAAKFAVRDALTRAKPVLLEPQVKLEVTTPAASLGDVTADLSVRRGRILGVTTLANGAMRVDAQAPLSELSEYAGRLRAVTGGQGTFVAELSQYDVLPAHLQQGVINSRKKS